MRTLRHPLSALFLLLCLTSIMCWQDANAATSTEIKAVMQRSADGWNRSI
jgi:hypothetical protein